MLHSPGWLGQPCEARQVRVIVADSPANLYWARHLVGTERAAVEITVHGITFYIDDEGFEQSEETRQYLRDRGHSDRALVGSPGWGWAKVMNGGSPQDDHASLVIQRVVDA